jgi:LPXTG-motif cell wall-anchored protein
MRRLLKITLLVGVLTLALSAPAMAQTDDDYTPDVGGITATREESGSSTGRLPFTGSDDAPSLIIVGLGLAAIGAVAVVAARRRSEVVART